MKPKVLFRVDANPEIGFGHLARCLNLIDSFNDIGAATTIVTATPEVTQFIRVNRPDLKHVLLCANNPSQRNYMKEWDVFSVWPQEVQTQDWLATSSMLQHKHYDLIVVDHYGLDAHWHSMCRTYTKQVLVIDDLANRKLDCDFLLDSNYYLKPLNRYKNLLSKNTEKFLGPKYLLKSRSLIQAAIKVDAMLYDRTSVSICFGGSDPSNHTAKAYQAMTLLPSCWKVQCVLGPQNLNQPKLIPAMADRKNFKLSKNPQELFQIIYNSAVSIGAAGGMMLERLLLYVPSIVLPIAENQWEGAQEMQKLKTIRLVSPTVLSEPGVLVALVVEIASDEKIRAHTREISNCLFGDSRSHNLVAEIIH